MNNKGLTLMEMFLVLLIYIIIVSFSVSTLSSLNKSAQCKKIASAIDTEVIEYIEALKGRKENRNENNIYFNKDIAKVDSDLTKYKEKSYEVNLSIAELMRKYNIIMRDVDEFNNCIKTESIYVGKVVGDEITIFIPLPIMTANNTAYESLGTKLFIYGETGISECASWYDIETETDVEYCEDEDYQLDQYQEKDRVYDEDDNNLFNRLVNVLFN